MDQFLTYYSGKRYTIYTRIYRYSKKFPGGKNYSSKKEKKKKAGSLLQRSILMVDFGARNGKGRGDKRAPIKIDMKSRIHVEGTPLYR